LLLLRVKLPQGRRGQVSFALMGEEPGGLFSVTDFFLYDARNDGGEIDRTPAGARERTGTPVVSGEQRWSLILYRPPRNFDPTPTSHEWDQTRPFQIRATLVDQPETTGTVELEIVRPLVVFL